MDDARLAALRLNLAPGVGPILAARLIERFGSAGAVFKQALGELERVQGVGGQVARGLLDPKLEARAEQEADLAASEGVRVLVLGFDDDYPRALALLPDPPPVLYIRGALTPDDAMAIGMVGARQASHYGRETARKFARVLATAGFTVVSGLARGVDTASHEGALSAGGRTIAFIGSGLLDLYPPENQTFSGEIAERGALISEFPLRTAPNAGNFPRRNRLIAGFALGTLVVEAGLKSGSLITARLAAEYGREVFAIPGRIDQERSRGCHRLIKNGTAKLVEELGDILDELGPLGAAMKSTSAACDPPRARDMFDARPGAAAAEPMPLAGLTPDEQTVYRVLDEEPQNLDEIAAKASLSAAAATSALMMLEIKTLTKRLAGKHFVRISRG